MKNPGLLFMLMASFCFSTVGPSMKYVMAAGIPFYEVVFIRGIAAAFILLLLNGIQGKSLRGNNYRLLFIRSIIGTVALILFTFSVSRIPLGDAYLLNRTAPIFIAILSGIILAESVPRGIFPLLVMAFIGVGLVTKPTGATYSWASLAALASGLGTAIAHMFIRRASEYDDDQVIIFHFMFISALCCIPFMVFQDIVFPTGYQWLGLGGVIAGSLSGQLLMTRGYRLEKATLASLITYSGVVLAAIWGWLFWDELWDIFDFVGAACIIITCILLTGLTNGDHSKHPAPYTFSR